jgi:hypothetical protein
MRMRRERTIVLLLGLALGAAAHAGVPKPRIERGQGEKCVEPTEVMRRNHMELIKHQRDLTMHQGIRTTKHSLVECVNCHAKADDKGGYRSVNAPGQFCAECHAYTGVKIDCFDCHATRPAPKKAAGEGATGGAAPAGTLVNP